jgi:hypothetical protein
VGLDRPNIVPGSNPYKPSLHNPQNVPNWLQPKGVAFVTNPPGTFGTARENGIIGPGYVDSDVTLVKSIPTFREENLQLPFEFFNVFNHTNFMHRSPPSVRRNSARCKRPIRHASSRSRPSITSNHAWTIARSSNGRARHRLRVRL